MDLAVEYIIRGGECESLLSLPTSVFLLDEKSRRHVLTVSPAERGRVELRYHNLSAVPRGTKTPAYSGVLVDREDLFKIRSDYRVLTYMPPPFPLTGATMYGDEPEASRQERAFQSYYKGYWNSQMHGNVRTQFLWVAFTSTQVGDELKQTFGESPPQAAVQHHDRNAWGVWAAWRKVFHLDAAGTPGELVFARCFKQLSPDQKVKYTRVLHWFG